MNYNRQTCIEFKNNYEEEETHLEFKLKDPFRVRSGWLDAGSIRPLLLPRYPCLCHLCLLPRRRRPVSRGGTAETHGDLPS